ncbi:MAG: 50S ribosomal protein L16 [Candidatus Algichlamydia australiensis]|nr:50S ribosomal protein L16 [Chlamydiales bacterium]
MKIPNKVKYRKQQKGSLRGVSKGAQFVDFGDFGMQALGRGRVTAQQIEACRVAINRFLSRKGKVWIRIFPDKPVSKKPAETRMGKGKGAPDHWVAQIKPGRILFEVGGDITKEAAQQALVRAAAKLPIKTRFVSRLEQV